jgi:hypothetical protein
LKPHPNKEALGVFKPTASLWHHRLGHASTHVIQQVLSRHKLPFVRDSSNNVICDACQKGKSHQLPYPKPSSVSLSPFELVFRCMGTGSYLCWSAWLLCQFHRWL